MAGLRQPVDPEGFYQACSPNHSTLDNDYLPKKSTCTSTTAVTATTNMSSRSIHSSSSSSVSMFPRCICPMTGVYASIANDYCISSEILGKGHYGIVRECIHRATHQTYAVKSIEKSKIRRLDRLKREIFLLASMDHHAILSLVDCYEDAKQVHIITEKCTGGELFDKIYANTSSHGSFSERKAVGIIKSLLEAVAYLHKNEVVHRDIKPENIMFKSNDEEAAIKLIDFGLSRVHKEGDAPMTNPVGTAYYMSPELLNGSYTKSADIWSVGVVTYILLSGYAPFSGKADSKRGGLSFHGTQWLNKSDDAIDFVKCLLTKDPGKRYTAEEALRHPWIRSMMTF